MTNGIEEEIKTRQDFSAGDLIAIMNLAINDINESDTDFRHQYKRKMLKLIELSACYLRVKTTVHNEGDFKNG